MNLKQRMLAAARGQMPDAIPFAPRIDIWFHANKARGTLPGRYRNAKSADEIALSEGWGLHKVIMEFMDHGEDAINIMKALVDSTDFYYRHRDQENEVLGLAEQIGVYFRKVFDVVAQCPTDVALVGANFDDMLTYPPFYEKHIMPWLQEASEKLHANHKLMLCHTDGENYGLMDLIKESGIDVAEAVCPYPMTKVSIAEYYRKWCDKLTIFGGIPSNLLLKETTTQVHCLCSALRSGCPVQEEPPVQASILGSLISGSPRWSKL